MAEVEVIRMASTKKYEHWPYLIAGVMLGGWAWRRYQQGRDFFGLNRTIGFVVLALLAIVILYRGLLILQRNKHQEP